MSSYISGMKFLVFLFTLTYLCTVPGVQLFSLDMEGQEQTWVDLSEKEASESKEGAEEKSVEKDKVVLHYSDSNIVEINMHSSLRSAPCMWWENEHNYRIPEIPPDFNQRRAHLS